MANEKRQLLHEIQEVGQKFESCTLTLNTYHGEWHAFISNLYDVIDIDWDGQEVKIIEKPDGDYFYSIYGEVFEPVKKAVRH
jgi:hypothetical protein